VLAGEKLNELVRLLWHEWSLQRPLGPKQSRCRQTCLGHSERPRLSGWTRVRTRDFKDRDEWERSTFNGGYHQEAISPSERPKYGALNFTGDPLGAAPIFGLCHLVLKDSVRKRTTVTFTDSSRPAVAQVGTLETLPHVLLNKSDASLRRSIEVQLGTAQNWRPEMRDPEYIEAQIHGPIELDRDVAEIVAHVRYRNGPPAVSFAKLAKKLALPLRWADDSTLY
jgi:hypothetical protein